MIWLLEGCLIIGFSILFWKYRSCTLQLQEHIHLQRRAHLRLQQDIRALCTGAVGVGQRLIELETISKHLSQRLEVSDHRDVSLSHYSHAAKLIELGATTEEVQTSCGLTQEEVELLHILHRQPEETE